MSRQPGIPVRVLCDRQARAVRANFISEQSFQFPLPPGRLVTHRCSCSTAGGNSLITGLQLPFIDCLLKTMKTALSGKGAAVGAAKISCRSKSSKIVAYEMSTSTTKQNMHIHLSVQQTWIADTKKINGLVGVIGRTNHVSRAKPC